MKRIIFRVDSSTQIGSGHFMRCLTLAKQLQDNAVITFVSRDLTGNLNYLVEKNGYRLLQLPHMDCQKILMGYERWLTVKAEVDAEQTKTILQGEKADCLIVDHYALDEAWEKKLRPYVKKIMVIDDLANRKHACNILLDQNFYKDMGMRYRDLVPRNCIVLLGPQYAMLREEFYDAQKFIRLRDGSIKNILVFFGGSDLTNETLKACKAITLLDSQDIIVNVVVGGSNSNKAVIREFCGLHPRMNFHCQIDYMANLMNEADLAIGAGGSTMWERCYLGLPAVVMAIAENQVAVSEYCHAAGYIEYLGEAAQVDEDMLKRVLSKFLHRRDVLKTMIQDVNSLHVGINYDEIFDCVME